MKKNDLILSASVATYSYLFYNQSAGINFLIMNFFLILLLILKNGVYKNLFNTSWWLSSLGCIASASCIVLYGNTLSVIANIISLSLLASYSIERNSSIVFAGLYSIYSYFSAIPIMIIDWSENKKKKIVAESKSKKSFLIYSIPVIITVIFFFLYREANPLFKNFTANINFDFSFISWSWVRFTILGFVLMYGFFYHQTIAMLRDQDLSGRNNLEPKDLSINNLWGYSITLSNEFIAGVILFSSLNILLLVVNILDFQYLWLSNSLPLGMNFSEAVHQGIGTLISSIILAVLIILVLFRGNLNFYQSARAIKWLAYIWVIQNAFMVISTILRNQLYINEYDLTYKRIGVYVYLSLVFIGLCTTLIKIIFAKSNWYLFRSNGWLFYSVLIMSCFFNWDIIITEFNLKNSKNLDRDYLIKLSSSNTFLLLNNPNFKIDSTDTSDSIIQMQNNFDNKLFDCVQFYEDKNWQSWNLDDQKGYHALLPKLKSIEKLNLVNNNNLKNISAVSKFENLRELTISNCPILDFTPLYAMKKLTHLYCTIDDGSVIDELTKRLPNTMIINSNVVINDYRSN